MQELIILICAAQALAILALIYSRHGLRLRHKAAKATLNRVAGERDTYRFHGERLAHRHPDDADALAILAETKKGK